MPQQFRIQARGLKEETAKLNALVAAHRSETANPAVVLLFLGREQAAYFHIYKWVRSVTELTDLANASVHRQDPPTAKFCAEMMETAEAGQETLSTAILGLTGVIGPKP